MTDTQNGAQFDLMGSINLALGKLNRHIDDQEARWRRNASRVSQPVYYPLADSQVVDANGNAVMMDQFQSGPDQGHFWHVRSIVIGGVLPTTAVVGRADIFATAMVPGQVPNYLQLLGTTQWRDFTTTLPSVAFYGAGELSLFPQDELLIIVSGATVGQTLVCNVSAWDYEQGAVGREWSI